MINFESMFDELGQIHQEMEKEAFVAQAAKGLAQLGGAARGAFSGAKGGAKQFFKGEGTAGAALQKAKGGASKGWERGGSKLQGPQGPQGTNFAKRQQASQGKFNKNLATGGAIAAAPVAAGGAAALS